MSIFLPDNFLSILGGIQSTTTLQRVRIVDAEYEKPDGSDLILDTDYFDQKLEDQSPVGPISSFKPGKNYIKVW